MSTISAVTEFTPGGVESPLSDRMERALVMKAKAAYYLDQIIAAPKAGLHWALEQARWALNTAAARYIRSKISWAFGVAGTAGTVNLAVVGLTTPQGRSGFDTVLRAAVRVAAWPLRVALAPLAWLGRHTGQPGAKVTAVAIVGYCYGRDKVTEGYTAAAQWLGAYDRHPLVESIRAFCAYSAISRLIRRFVPAGPWRIGAYLGTLLAMPKAVPSTFEVATRTAHAAAQRVVGALSAPADTDVAAEVPAAAEASAHVGTVAYALDPTCGTVWELSDGTCSDPDAVTVEVPGADGKPVAVTVHALTDGTTAYQIAGMLLRGKVPDGINPSDLAEAVAKAPKLIGDGDAPVPASRGDRRAAKRANGRRQATAKA